MREPYQKRQSTGLDRILTLCQGWSSLAADSGVVSACLVPRGLELPLVGCFGIQCHQGIRNRDRNPAGVELCDHGLQSLLRSVAPDGSSSVGGPSCADLVQSIGCFSVLLDLGCVPGTVSSPGQFASSFLDREKPCDPNAGSVRWLPRVGALFWSSAMAVCLLPVAPACSSLLAFRVVQGEITLAAAQRSLAGIVFILRQWVALAAVS